MSVHVIGELVISIAVWGVYPDSEFYGSFRATVCNCAELHTVGGFGDESRRQLTRTPQELWILPFGTLQMAEWTE